MLKGNKTGHSDMYMNDLPLELSGNIGRCWGDKPFLQQVQTLFSHCWGPFPEQKMKNLITAHNAHVMTDFVQHIFV